jgi:hypothetical protein
LIKIILIFSIKNTLKFLDFLLLNIYAKILIIFLSTISLFYGLYVANTFGSIDFQYSPTTLFLDKINPYDYFLYSPKIEKIILSQAPVYAHFTYILLSPFAFIKWEAARLVWSLINILLGYLIVVFLCKKNNYNSFDTLFILSIFYLSTPFRVCLGNGQISLLILASFCCIFIKNLNTKSILLGFSYIKYSFSPILAFVIIFKYGLKYFFISGLLGLIGWILFSIYLHQEIFYTLFQPLQVGLKAFGYNFTTGDLFTILKDFFKFSTYTSILIVLFFNLYISKKISKISDDMLFLGLISLVNLMSFGHLIYDYIFLLPLLIYNFKDKSKLLSKISIFIIFYFFYGIKLIEFLQIYFLNEKIVGHGISFVIINFILMSILFAINYCNLNNFFNIIISNMKK